MADEKLHDNEIQHSLDDSHEGDPQKGAVIGGVGGAAVGAAAGSMVGPVGALIGGAVGAVAGAAASAAAVAAIDSVEEADTGLINEFDLEEDEDLEDTPGMSRAAMPGGSPIGAGTETYAEDLNRTRPLDHDAAGSMADTLDEDEDVLPGNRQPGIQTGGYAADGTPDTRGIGEKAADALTGDRIDDKTGKRIP